MTCYSRAMLTKVNYAKLLTEQQNPRTKNFDQLSTLQMLKLINEEDRGVPQSIEPTFPAIEKAVSLMVKSIKGGGRVFFVGAGTSGRFGILEAAECPPTFGTSPALIQGIMAGGKQAVFRSKEGAEDNFKKGYITLLKKTKKNDCVIGIAASGVTPFVHGALKAASKKKLSSILITCSPSQEAKKAAMCLIAPMVGPEIISGSTRLKAGTATKLVLNMLTVTTMARLGKIYQNWMVDLRPKSLKLQKRAIRIVSHLGTVSEEVAERKLSEAGKSAKLAILMARSGKNAREAKKILKHSNGFLRKALAVEATARYVPRKVSERKSK